MFELRKTERFARWLDELARPAWPGTYSGAPRTARAGNPGDVAPVGDGPDHGRAAVGARSLGVEDEEEDGDDSVRCGGTSQDTREMAAYLEAGTRVPLRMNAKHIRTLFLDAGSVLVHPNWWRISDIFARHGLQVAPAALRDADPHVRFSIDAADRVATTNDAQRGGLFFQAILDRAGVARGPAREAALADVYAYHTAHNIWEHVEADVRPALERLKASGVQLVVASNANGAIERMFHRVGLAPYFHTICDSHVEGVEKPDPRFFRIVLERCGGTADTTVHVGDLYHVDVAGARSAGLGAMLFDPHDLYGGFDVDRVRSLAALADRVERSTQ